MVRSSIMRFSTRTLLLCLGSASFTLARCVGDSPVVVPDSGPDVTTDSPAPNDSGGNDVVTTNDAQPTDAADAEVDAGPQGVIDTTFANGTKTGLAMNFAFAVAVDSQSRVYIAGNQQNCVSGSSGWDDAIFRFDSSGNLDATYGNAGTRCIDFDTNDGDGPNAIALDSTDNLFVAGSSWVSGTYNASVAKLNPSGTVLWRYRYNGSGSDAGASPIFEAHGIAFDGARVYAVGTNGLYQGTRTASFVLGLQSSTGALDPNFNGGIATDSTAYAYYGATTSGGKLLAVGGTPGANRKMLTRRFTTNGFPDPTFGTANAEIATQTSTSGYDSGYSVAVQSDGKVLVAGPSASKATGSSYSQLVVARYDANGGALDATFASGSGKPGVYFSALEFLDGDSAGYQMTGMILEPSGKIVLGGHFSTVADGGAPRDFALVRLNTDGTLDTTFGQNGIARANFATASFVNGIARDPATGNIVLLGHDNFGDPVLFRFTP